MENSEIKEPFFSNLKKNFDFITSNNGKSWLLALNWICIFEFMASIIEYEFIDDAKNYIQPLESHLYKELAIAIFVVLILWYLIYNFIYLEKRKYLKFTFYMSVCVYLILTDDFSFNLLFNNLNPSEIFINGFGFYMFIQIFLKLLILYLLYKVLTIIKKAKSDF